MKKLILTIGLILGVSAGLFAQKSNVKKANSLIMQEKPNFKEARKLIKDALEHDATKNDPRTFFTAGMIGYMENDNMNNMLMLGRESDVDSEKKGKAIMESLDYFLKAYEIDQQPNAKGKVRPKYTKKIRENVGEYFTAQYNLIGYGADLFEKREYLKAHDVFSTYLSIPDLPFMDLKEAKNDSTYKMIKYFSALSLTNAKEHEGAIAVYEDLKNDDYETKNVYQLLSEEYQNIKNEDKYLAVLEEAFGKYPEDPWFLQNIINYYIQKEQIEKASDYLNEAIKQTPNVAEYYFVRGNIQERMEDVDGAEASFNKAIELQPTFAGAYAGLGRIIFNRGVEILKAADQIRDNREYNEAVEKANQYFRASMPYMEKAVELDQNDEYEYKQNLKMLYYRLGEDDKYNALIEELGE